MIEKLKNCPNCAGILDDVGRCKYCGSKVYDFLSLDFSPQGRLSGSNAKTYIRIRFDNKECIMPILFFQSASITTTPRYASWQDECMMDHRIYEGTDRKVELSCYCGDMIIMEEENETSR